MNLSSIAVQSLYAPWIDSANISLDVLRLDLLHPVVSGNKWFKLKYYLQQASRQNKHCVATFGGAWSNHIVATAYACQQQNIACIGIIRGEQPAHLSFTLRAAQNFGMHLHFVSRASYSNKKELVEKYTTQGCFVIAEGGYGEAGARGAADILRCCNASLYSHIIVAVGTGTTLAGLTTAAHPGQQVIGISSMKSNYELPQQVANLLPPSNANKVVMFHDYHFGGYAKHPPELIAYINAVYVQHHLPLDIVYTGKAFYATQNLAAQQYFAPGSKLLFIHTGGLQGNASLPHEVVTF